MTTARSILRRTLIGALGTVVALVVAAGGVYVYHAWPVALPPTPEQFEVIAHRGVHEGGLTDG